MKRHLLLFILLLTLGVGWSKAQNTNVGSGPYEFTLGTGTGTTDYLPLKYNYNYSLSQQLYLASELTEAGMTTRPVGSISFYSGSTYGYNLKGTKIWMANVSESVVSATSLRASNMTLVYDGAQTEVVGWNEFNLNGDFAWDGTSNILVLFQSNRGTWSSSIQWQYTKMGFYAGAYCYTDGSAYNAEASTYNMTQTYSRANTMFKSGPINSPQNLRASNVTQTSAQVSWTAGGEETTWNLRYRKTGVSGWTSIASLNSNSYTFENLEAYSSYEVQVQAVIGDELSSWTSSLTICTISGQGGSGTEDDPYKISSTPELEALANLVNLGSSFEGVYFGMTQDLSLASVCHPATTRSTEVSWMPIGSYEHPFKGHFDGGDHVISDLYINYPSSNSVNDYQGLFGYVTNGSISNLTVSGTVTAPSRNWIGGVCAYNDSGSISNCTNRVTIEGYNIVGGICAYLKNAVTIVGCRNEANIKGGYSVGGICGSAESEGQHSVVSLCQNTGTVQSTSNTAGGIAGSYNGQIDRCLNAGQVTTTNSSSNIGGVVGLLTGGSLQDCMNAGLINGNNYVGGIAGYGSSASLSRCYNIAPVTGSTNVGLLAGVFTAANVSECYYDNQICAGSTNNYGVGHPTSEMTGNLFVNSNSHWVQAQNLYPRINGLHDSDLAKVLASPVFLPEGQNSNEVASDFSVSTVLIDATDWSANPSSLVIINNDGSVTNNGGGSVTLTATKGGYSKSVTLKTVTNCTISTAEQLFALAAGISQGNAEGFDLTIGSNTVHIPQYADGVVFTLNNDINLDPNGLNTPWAPIGTSDYPFKGSFDGNRHTVSGLYIDNTSTETGINQGFIGYFQGTNIKNLTVKGSVLASQNAAGVCGYNAGGLIENCQNDVAVQGYQNVGGVCGYNNGGRINLCINTGNVTIVAEGAQHIGGVCGFVETNSTISQCLNIGAVSTVSSFNSVNFAGGICGRVKGTIEFCANAAPVVINTGNFNYIGGIAGYLDGTGRGCYNVADVLSNSNSAASLFAYSYYSSNCYFDKQMTLASYTSGTNKTTAQMTSGSLFNDATHWVETSGLYPRIKGMENTDAALVAASPVLLETSEVYNNVMSAFTLGRADEDIEWSEADNDDLVTIGNDGACTINASGDVTLNCALNDVSRNVTLHVIKLWEGEGTEVSPYLIACKADMENLAGMVNDGTDYQGVYFKVTSDIDLECDASHPWTPIGNNTNSFKGYFDGDGHTISNMVITNANGQYQGLFGCTTNAEISNLTVAGSMTGDDYTAGVVGCMFGGRVYNCINNVTCSAGNFIAGICGTLKENGILENCINAADLTAAQPGGICQNCNDNSQILNCRNDGDITKTGTNEDYGAGGICQINYGTISNCCNTGSVSGNNYVGGICGYNYNKIEKCYNLGLVEGNYYVGGICGYEYSNSTYNNSKIEKCYNLGLVEGNYYVGGICGYEYSNSYGKCYVEYSVNVGEVHANYYYGGVVGTIRGYNSSYRANCTNCINMAPVIGIPDNTNTGGVIGQFYNSYYTVNNCYYDKQMCTIEDNSWVYPHGVSLSTAEMTSGNLFDNDNWVETSGLYPRIAGMDDTDAALVAASPVFLGGFDASFVMGGFSVGKANEDVVWSTSNNLVSIGDDGTCTINGSGDVTLTCTLNGISKSVTLHVEESPWEGAGTQANPYEISNAQELSALSRMVDEGMSFKNTYFIMTNDIDLSAVCGAGMGENDENINWMPIGGYYYDYEEGYKESYFSGHFDGGFHTVSNLYINDPENDYIYAGLFGWVDCGSISNLAVAGYVYGGENTAGICANLTGGTISHCHNAATVHNNYTAGGIVAHFENSENTEESHIGTITDCYNTGAITGYYNAAGGICGNLSNSQSWNEDLEDYEFTCRILNCYNIGQVSGSQVGAICYTEGGLPSKGGDRSEFSNVVNCYYDKQMSLASDGNAIGLLTSQMTTSNELFGNDNANWVYENGLYPRLTGMDDSDVAVLHATPIFLNGDETVAGVFSDFNVSVLPDGIQWTSSNATEGLTVTIAQIAADGLKAVSFTGNGSFDLTATLGTASRTVSLRIPYVFEITSAAQLARLSYILSDDVEWNNDGYQWVDANGDLLEDGHLVPPYAFDTYFKLMNDISLAAICGEGVGNWQPIGYDGFMGHFNGNGHTISDLYINDEESANQALFGGVDDGSISNLTVEGSVKAESYVAGICVYLRNNGTLTNCHNAVALSAYSEYSYAGGVCVENYGTISNCSNSAHLEAFNVGGVCQENSGRIDHCYNAGTIEGSYIGGICSYNNDGTTISNCYNVGTLTGAEEVYGIAYNGWSSKITDCFNAGTLSGGSVYGIGYGYDGSYFTNCYNTGALFGDEYVAAICNSAEDGGGSGPSKGNNNVTNCFYDKQICTATDADATGLLTSEMTSGNSIFGAGNSNWIYTENFYPLLAGMNETDAAQVAAEPLFLSATDNAGSVIGSFSVNGTSGITWTATTNPSGILTVDGNTYTFAAEGEAEMRCSKGGIEKAVSLYHPEVKVITTAAQLAELATGVNSGEEFSITGLGTFPAGGEDSYFVLGNDIDLNGSAESPWTPIGTVYEDENEDENPIPFVGHFNGNGKTISGLYVDSENGYQGLFGYVAYSSILNLTVEGEVHGGEYEIGGICGRSIYATFKNCVSNVEVTGIEDVAGICGGSRNITIENCVNNGNVNGAQCLGGIVGYASGDNNIVKNCANNAPVVVEQPENEEDWGYDVGGICGILREDGIIKNCTNNAQVTGYRFVGGICGHLWNDGRVFASINVGAVSGGFGVGGICGVLTNDAEVSATINAGAVSANYEVAGICGAVQSGTISNSYNVGMVSSNDNYAAPLCRWIDEGGISNCYYDYQMCPIESVWDDVVALSTAALTSSDFNGLGDAWTYTEGLYPRISAIANTDAALVAAAPIFLDEEETVNSIFNASFTVSTANGVAWSSDSDIATVNGNTVTLNGSGNFVLTASLNGVEKHVAFKMPIALDMTHPFAEDFNESNSFEILSSYGVNHWTVGTECGPEDGLALYVTDGENGYFYDEDTYSFSMASLNMNVTAGTYEISYDWKGVAEGQYDFLRVVLLPADADFDYEDIDYDELPDNCIPLDGMHGLSGASTWQTNNVEFVVTENGSYNLLVVWMNDGSYSNGIPAAVDNINIVGVACPRPTGLMASVDGYSVTLDWDDNDNATGWEYACSMTEGTPTAAGTATEYNRANITVEEAGIYYAYVRASYSDGYSRWASCKFVVVDFDGSGTESDPYQIYDREDMDMLSDAVNAGVPFEGQCFKVMNDINLGGEENPWTPIGGTNMMTETMIPFSGHFDGDGNTISGLYVDSENGYHGLFGYVAYSSILNLTVEGEVHGGEYQIGGICGWSDYATFKNCVSNVEVTGFEDVAGICGGSFNITIENCVNNGNVNGVRYLGGIVGYAYGDNIVKNCANNAPVIAEQPEGEVRWGYVVGGICSYVEGTVSNSYNAGTVVGNYECGPICGKIYGTITNCYFDTDMCSGFESYVADGVSGAPSSDFTSGILPYGFDSDVWYAVPGSYPRLIDNDHVMALPVMAYEEEEVVRDGEPFGGWYLVASPMVNSITPSVNNGLLNDPEGADFDLYGFNIRESGEEWCNVKDESNEIVVMNGKGYLVANGKNTVVRFTGDFHAEEEVVVSGISGWGLVGNPLGTVATVSCDYYKMNANHSELVLCEAGTTVNPGEAIFVNSSSVTFTPANASAPVSSPMLNLNLSNAENGLIDRASIRFGEGKSLDKFMLDEANTQLYMPQGEKRYAVVATNAKAGEMPVNFKAEKQGSYTLSVEMKDVTIGSLRLIDKLTGADIDLLATPSYTFMASPSDSAERFTVVIR